MAMLMIPNLLKRGVDMVAYDALAMDQLRQIFDGSIRYAESADDCLQGAAVVVLGVRSASCIAAMQACTEDVAVLDVWRQLPEDTRYTAV